LRVFTAVTALGHLGSGIAVATADVDMVVPLQVNVVNWPERGTPDAMKKFAFGQKHAGSMSIKACIAGFFFLSSGFQILPVLFWRPFIQLLTTRGIQPLRWIEYSFSASLMAMIFALLLSIRDVLFLQLIFASTWTVMMLGLVQEVWAFKTLALRKERPVQLDTWLLFVEDLLPHIIGWIIFISTFGIFITTFQESISSSPTKPPSWVTIVYSTQAIFFGSFGVNQLVQQVRLRRGGLRSSASASLPLIALQHEFVYVLLSISSKQVLAWILYVNLNAESSIRY
jgi:hypothetical protein